MTDAQADPLVGQHLAGYEVLELLARGGMATVYRAYQPRLNRAVAIKTLLPHVVDETARYRFRREAELAARLEHPNILGVYDYGEHDGRLYIVMPYVPGGTLEQRLRATPPLARNRALGLLLQVCSALAYAHRQRVVHRDVKPSNIFLRAQNWALLADFGIARLLETAHLTARGTALGTPAYMAPEQAAGLPSDYRVDVYAVGVVLYRLLAGQLPFQGSPAAVLGQQIAAPVPALALPEDLAAVWQPVLGRALAKEPAARYGSMEELAAAVQAAMHAERGLAAAAESDRPAAVPVGAATADTAAVTATRPAVAARAAAPLPARPGGTAPAGPPRRTVLPQPGQRARQQPRRWLAPSVLTVVGAVLVCLLTGLLVVRAATGAGTRTASASGRAAVSGDAAGAPTAAAAVPAASPGAPPPVAAMAPPARPAGTVLLRDDFSDPASGWPRQSTDPVRRRVGYVDGEYLVAKEAGSRNPPLVTRPEQFDNFLLEIDVRLAAPTRDTYAFIDFRRQDNDDHYSLLVDPNDSTFRLERNVGRSGGALIDWTPAAAIRGDAARNRIGVRAQGAELAVFANGEEIGRVRDPTLQAGGIGFGVNSFVDGRAEARFANLVVTALPPGS